jgi:hypothetical protein
MKRCHDCAKVIQDAAVVRQFCNRDLQTGGSTCTDVVRSGRHRRWKLGASLILATFALTNSWTLQAGGQSLMERIVGPTEDQKPLVTVLGNDIDWLPNLARAAGVRIGIELAGRPLPQPVPEPDAPRTTFTGLTLQDALGHHLSTYSIPHGWREIDGLLVIRPVVSWNDQSHPLSLPAPAFRAADLRPRHALALVCAILGAPDHSEATLLHESAPRVALDFSGGTVLDLLNELVRTDAGFAWSATFVGTPARPRSSIAITLLTSRYGYGKCAAPGQRRSMPLDPDTYLANLASRVAPVRPLDRIIGLDPNGRRIEMTGGRGPGPLTDLSRTTGTPFGMEGLPPETPILPAGETVTLSGKSLRAALDIIVALDPRFEWREMNGVVVVRPVYARTISNHPLTRPFGGFVGDVTTSAAIDTLASLMGSRVPQPYRDTTPVSLDVPAGTILDFLNAIARANGKMRWSYTKAFGRGNPPRRGPDGEQHELSIWSHDWAATSFWVK